MLGNSSAVPVRGDRAKFFVPVRKKEMREIGSSVLRILNAVSVEQGQQ